MEESQKFNADDVQNADTLGDTEFSELFHAARTTSREVYTGVSVPVRHDEDGNITDVGEIVKTRQGENFHVRNSSWDATVSLSVRPFMDTDRAREDLVWKLRNVERQALGRKEMEEDR